MMIFHGEPVYYKKTILSDLEGAWRQLRDSIIGLPESDLHKKILFHIDEGMSWESVRSLKQMQQAIIMISNFINHESVPNEIAENVQAIHDLFNEALDLVNTGESV